MDPIKTDELNLLERASYLLPNPGGDVVRDLIEDIRRKNAEIERLCSFVTDVSEDMECLPECDSHVHADLCPVTNPVEAWRMLRLEIERLKAGYSEAIEDIESWAAYAMDYFKEKHNLEGDLARHRAILKGESPEER